MPNMFPEEKLFVEKKTPMLTHQSASYIKLLVAAIKISVLQTSKCSANTSILVLYLWVYL